MYRCWNRFLDANIVLRFVNVLQFTGDNEEEVVEKRLWRKGNYAELSNSILAVD